MQWPTQTDGDGFQTSNTQYNKCAHNVYVQVKMLLEIYAQLEMAKIDA